MDEEIAGLREAVKQLQENLSAALERAERAETMLQVVLPQDEHKHIEALIQLVAIAANASKWSEVRYQHACGLAWGRVTGRAS